MQCDGWCDFRDSYLLADYGVSGAHMGAFLDNGNGARPITLDHDTLLCKIGANSPGLGTGGCSADANFYGDFAPISNITVTNTLLKATNDAYFCAYTGANQPAKTYKVGTHLSWTNNVFERGTSGICGSVGGGPVADWSSSGTGNTWCNNTWVNTGTPVITNGVCN